MGMSSFEIVVLRCAEIPAPQSGSQLWDYLQTRVCLRPLGFDPMINLLSLEDAARAVRLALAGHAQGIFNIPGADTLPLSRIIALAGRRDVPVPGPLIAPLYELRTRVVGLQFRYDLNARRFHFGGVVDGSRAQSVLDYRPSHPLVWPRKA
jgi:UDP-glucose 4-epimerase